MGSGIWCIMFTGRPITDDIRDALFIQAYLMLRTSTRSKRFKSREYNCEGVVTTEFERYAHVGTSGYLFDAIVECEAGELKVQYLLRDQDLRQLEEEEGNVAWMSPDEDWEDLAPERIRENPIRKVAHGLN